MKELIEKIKEFLTNQLLRYQAYGFLVCISGGIDSAAAIKIAVDAVGKDKVFAMICRISNYTDDIELNDGLDFCQKLGVQIIDADITDFFYEVKRLIPNIRPKVFVNSFPRLRSIIAYAIADQFRLRIIGTANKSECLLQGFLHFSNAADTWIFTDIYKTDVTKIAKDVGVPDKIINKEPNDSVINGIKDKYLFLGYGYETIDPLLKAIERKDKEYLKKFKDADLVELLNHLIKLSSLDKEFPEFRVSEQFP